MVKNSCVDCNSWYEDNSDDEYDWNFCEICEERLCDDCYDCMETEFLNQIEKMEISGIDKQIIDFYIIKNYREHKLICKNC